MSTWQFMLARLLWSTWCPMWGTYVLKRRLMQMSWCSACRRRGKRFSVARRGSMTPGGPWWGMETLGQSCPAAGTQTPCFVSSFCRSPGRSSASWKMPEPEILWDDLQCFPCEWWTRQQLSGWQLSPDSEYCCSVLRLQGYIETWRCWPELAWKRQRRPWADRRSYTPPLGLCFLETVVLCTVNNWMTIKQLLLENNVKAL